MLKRSWRRSRSPALWAFALVWLAPSLASAQQSGLFPLHPIRRQRVPCPMEDPVYGLYRQQYYGYHPTCWRRFPDGWGCPSPDAPNAEAEFQKLKRGPAPELAPPDEMGPPGGPGTAPEDGGRAPGAPGPGALPPLPSGERNPFQLDTPDTTKPRTGPPARRDRTTPDTGTNPPAPPPATTQPEAAGAQALAPLAPVLEATPSASETESAPPLLTLPEPSASTSTNELPPLPPIGPDVALPGPSASSAPATPVPSLAPAAPLEGAPPELETPPARAPRRPSRIGSFLGGLGLRRR